MTSLRPTPERHRIDEVVLVPHGGEIEISLCPGHSGRRHHAFHSDTIPLSGIRRIGIAANNATGNNVVKVLDMEN